MKPSNKSLWICIFLLSASVLWRCGRKSSENTAESLPDLAPSVPAGWNGEDDWAGNALQIEDLAP